MNTTTPGQHRRDEGGHGLAEHVAERQQVQEADGKKRPRVFAVFLDLAFHRNDVRENVAMRDDDALGLGGGAGGEDDFGDLVFVDGDWRRGGTARASLKLASVQTSRSRASETSSPVRIARALTMSSMRATKSGEER